MLQADSFCRSLSSSSCIDIHAKIAFVSGVVIEAKRDRNTTLKSLFESLKKYNENEHEFSIFTSVRVSLADVFYLVFFSFQP